MVIFKSKKQRNVIIISLIFLIALALLVGFVIIPNQKYEKALAHYQAGNYNQAIKYFYEVKDYSDSKKYISKIMDEIATRETVSTSEYSIIAIKENGTIESTGYGPYEDCDFSDWTRIISVSNGGYHAVGLRKNGSVVATGSNDSGQCEVEDWENIVEVIAGTEYIDHIRDHKVNGYTIGLKSDGTIEATGVGVNILELSTWEEIISISEKNGTVVGVKADGTIMVSRNNNGVATYDVSDWTDLAKAYVFTNNYDDIILGIKTDGTIISNSDDFDNLSNVADFSSPLDSYGTYAILYDNGKLEVSDADYEDLNSGIYGKYELEDAVAVCCEKDFVLVLNADGSIEVFGEEGYWYDWASHWTDIRIPRTY